VKALKQLSLLALEAVIVPMLAAEQRCPGNVATVTPRFVQRALIVIPVWINQTGPYDFLVDTGTQITAIDPSLARELGLKPRGTIGVFTVASYARAPITILDTLEANSHVVEKPLAIVQDFREIQAIDSHIRGTLGENFLARFDLLIDYAHKLLCLDETKVMRGRVHGEHIPLLLPKYSEDEMQYEGEMQYEKRLVVSVNLSRAGRRQILLQLDSGCDGPLLYAGNREREPEILNQATLRVPGTSKAQKAFAVLPPQDIRIGSLTLSGVPFVTPVNPEKNAPSRQEDGLLPTMLFQRVFISGSDDFAIFQPW
jgi:hypothetical protein